MALRTTTIGAFPKPDYLKLPDWFNDPEGTNSQAPTSRWAAAMDELGEELPALLERAARDVVGAQVDAGIDIPTDGEVPRENYIHYHCRHLNGIDFDRLTERDARAGDYITRVPTSVAPISLRDDYITRDWKRAQAHTDRPVKITMPGPMTTRDTTGDDYYNDEAKCGAAYADALNVAIRALADAGCRHIQLDEPVFVRYVPKVLEFGIENLERAFHKCPSSVTRTIHICCSYPGSLDAEFCPKGPKEAYLQVAPYLDESSIQAVSLEDAHRHNDGELFEMFQHTTVILGCFDIGTSRVEESEEIRTRLAQVLEHIDADRLMLAPDCGLGLLGTELAVAKLRNLCEAAGSV
jgi:5-methyltetrahydropteroyltriglutamate--homocysteine methyltransferase